MTPDYQHQHLEEFTASAIDDPALIDLNIRSIDLSWVTQFNGGEIENDSIPFILDKLNWNISRLANGRINNPTLDRVRKMGGGWHILPFYGLADRAQIDYFRFKPNNPPPDPKKTGKVKKYLGAVNESPRAYSPNVSESMWAAIACRYGVEKTGIEFWEWILEHPEIPVLITEGEKKALSGINAGYVVVSLPGIDCGYQSIAEDDGSNKQLELIPDLKALTQGERTIYIAFDRDRNRKTERSVQIARHKLARLLGELGCQIYSVRWDNTKYKGLDDFIASAGVDALTSAIDGALNITPKPQTDVGEKTKGIPSALSMADAVSEDLFKNVRYEANNKQWWRYDDAGKFLSASDEYIFGLVQKYLKELLPDFSPSYVRNCLEFARTYSLKESWTEASSRLFIPFSNGVLDVKNHQLLPHSPDYGFTWQLPRPYSIVASDFPNISKFIDTICCANEQLKDILEAFCNAALKGRADLQKFLYLFGTGANGKGAFMTLLRMLVGAENTHATTLSDLTENRFESANLQGKRLVMMTDEDKHSKKFGVFKAATGQDAIRFERKGKDATNFIFQGMVVMAANAPTFAGDSDYAIKRRKISFPCSATIPEQDRRDLTPEFEAELPAFTTYLLSLSDKWVEATLRNARMVDAVKQLEWDLSVRENSTAAFLNDRLIVDAKGSIACGRLYEEYRSYCEKSGLNAKSINNFTPSLLDLCVNSLGHKNVVKEKGRSNNAIKGLHFKSFDDEDGESSAALVEAVDTCGGGGGHLQTSLRLNGGSSGYLSNSNEKFDKKDTVGEENTSIADVHISPSSVEIDIYQGDMKMPPQYPLASTIDSVSALQVSTKGIHHPQQVSATFHQRPPAPNKLKVGDRLEYIGLDKRLQNQYAGILLIHECHTDGTYTCLKTDGRLTSRIDPEALRLMKAEVVK